MVVDGITSCMNLILVIAVYLFLYFPIVITNWWYPSMLVNEGNSRWQRRDPPKNPDFCPWAECVRELWQTVWEFVNITYRDVMQGLEIEKCEDSCPGVTIFSWVLANPINEPRVVEDPHQEFPPKDEAIWCVSPPQGLEQCERYMLVVTLSVGRLDLGAGGNNVGESQGGRSLFWNPQMLAVFPPPRAASCYGGTTLTELDLWRISQIANRQLTEICHWADEQSFPP